MRGLFADTMDETEEIIYSQPIQVEQKVYFVIGIVFEQKAVSLLPHGNSRSEIVPDVWMMVLEAFYSAQEPFTKPPFVHISNIKIDMNWLDWPRSSETGDINILLNQGPHSSVMVSTLAERPRWALSIRETPHFKVRVCIKE